MSGRCSVMLLIIYPHQRICIQKMWGHSPQNIALGIVLGCGEPAFQLARATTRFEHAYSLSKSQDELIEIINVRPIESLIQMLMADYLEEPLFPEGSNAGGSNFDRAVEMLARSVS